jgi:type IV pilus assembly protein PilQ
MRDLAMMTRRRGAQQAWVNRSGVAVVVLAIAWILCPQPAATAPAPATAQIQGIEVHEEALGTRVEVTTDGTPIWTTYRDAEGNLVVELANSLPTDSVTSLSPETGLLRAVEVEVEESLDHPMTRLVIETRSDAEHSVVADGPNLRIDLMPMATTTAISDRVESTETEEIAEESAYVEPTPVAVVEPVPGPSGEPIGDVVASQLQTVQVDHASDGTTVRIQGDGEFFYSTLTLGAPDRFVVDLIGVVNMVPNSNIAVENDFVERIRIAQFKSYPEPVSRVVVDLRDATGAQVAATSDGLAVTFGDAENTLALAEEPTEVEAVVAELVEEPAPEPEPIIEEVATEWEAVVAEDAGMGSNETGGTGSHELSSLASAVATDHLEEELAPEPEPLAAEPVEEYQPEPQMQIAEAFPDPEPVAYASPDPDDAAEVAEDELPASFAGEAVGVKETTYTGAPMTISLKDGDIKDVLRSFAQISGLNVVVQPGVSGTVTVELTDVPWDQALEQILKINGLGYELEGNIMRVAPTSQLRAEAEEQQRLLAAQSLSIPLTTMMKRVSYAGAAEIAGILKAGGGASIMSSRGSVVVDARTNTLIIKELPDYMDTVMAVIENLDVPEPQVMIESRIIETTKRFSQTLGIQWNFLGTASAEYGNTTGLVFPNNGTVEGGVDLLTGGSNGFLDIALGNVLDTFTLDMTLQAAENEGLINILSAPKVTTLNNERAEIQSGLQIPIQTVANNTVSVQFVNATLRLEVTPHVTAEGTVLMDIDIQKREPLLAFAVVGSTNAPISTKDARTRVIVRDGGTTVIGGIYEVSTDRGEDRVPGLANVPVLGHLFKNKRRNDENEELLIFITPRVMKL